MFRPTYLDVSPSLTTTHRNVPFTLWGVVVADVLMVGGGGAAGYGGLVGGGGGGGYLEGSMSILSSTRYQVVVGAGGARVASGYVETTGSTSTFNNVTALGGSGGGFMGTASGQPTMTGGSGGGRAGFTDNSQCGHIMNYGQSSSGSMTGYANTGSTFCCSNVTGCPGCYSSGGGGGAGGAGGNQTNCYGAGATGGAGKTWSINGTCYAGGGSAGGEHTNNSTAQCGGKGGGSDQHGDANTGGGGGGGVQGATGSNGGSGIVIIRYSGAPRATGGTITFSGGYTIHTFTSSGFFQGK